MNDATLDVTVAHVFETWGDKLHSRHGAKPCFICKTDTEWIDISFECRLCSPECDRTLTRQWAEDYNAATEEYGPPTMEDAFDALFELTVEVLTDESTDLDGEAVDVLPSSPPVDAAPVVPNLELGVTAPDTLDEV